MKDRRVNLRIKSPGPAPRYGWMGRSPVRRSFLSLCCSLARQSYWKLMRFRCSSIHLKMIRRLAFNQFRMAEYRAKTGSSKGSC
jgi:hypothetical protein